MAILGFLNAESIHGYELKQRLNMLAGYYRPLSDGALYPAIARLERRGLLERRQEPGEAGAPRQVLSLTSAGRDELLNRLRQPSDIDISDRNHFYTILAFLSNLNRTEQVVILKRRLTFIDAGRGFFAAGGKAVRVADERDPFRRGMLLIARETSRVERQWLQETIAALSTD